MQHEYRASVERLREILTLRRYNPAVVHNYIRNADCFLSYLAERKIAFASVTPTIVSDYLRLAVRQFRKRHGHAPAEYWVNIPRAGIHALLRHVLKSWPPEPTVADAGERLCREVCDHYQTWLREERGLAEASIYALMWEAKHFCGWYTKRSGTIGLKELSVSDIDDYMDMRAPKLTRRSLKDVAERLRSLLKHLHRTGHTGVDLTPYVIAPLLYAYEGIPSALNPDQIAAVLEVTSKDRSPLGLRDYAILQLLAVYGLRSGEVSRLRLQDIDWRGDVLHIRHSKSGARSVLPLLEPVGEAVIAYLRYGRPETDVREIFVRTRAPYVPMVRIYSEVRRRIEAAGIELSGKRGPHIFRHARAVSLLRAEVPRKVIGDVLGHRSTESTIPYLKLATEDLRAIALEIPGAEVSA
ncbi:site-specific integrase [Sinorhizobium meliloti]|uniref:site-specific integrase n=1 Tax=Rhizobium meliloti TaxID=382 RepID=UPI000FDC7B07|nr:site-specific integrase [Sinorhizobium meliloti]RVE82839.1 integrase [Sinorhizobium meliloti]RVH23679.1 integrase [Sinorhizobium meliloti]